MPAIKRDIDDICRKVSRCFSSVEILQLNQPRPTDDNGIWWFRLPGDSNDIQIESSTGQCPFIIEHDDMTSASEAEVANTVEAASEQIIRYLDRRARDAATWTGPPQPKWPTVPYRLWEE